jgi:glycosyltransferase involved in cell wall biosynthesis
LKRVLIVTPTATHPTTSGTAARVLTLTDALRSLGCQINLLYLGTQTDAECPAFQGYWGTSLHRPTDFPLGVLDRLTQPLRRVWKSVVWHTFQRLTGGRVPVDLWYNRIAARAVGQLHRRLQFDVVFVEYVVHSWVLPLFDSNVIKVIDTIDAVALRTEQFGPARREALACYPISRAQEGKGLNRADVVIAIQPEEKAYFSTLTSKPVVIVGHLLSVLDNSPLPPEPSVLFVGGYYPLNFDAVDWLVKYVWPIVRRAVPNATLTIAGAVSRAYPTPPAEGITVLGEVSDLRPVYQSHRVVVNPTQLGSGLAIKSIEALGAGRPLVATSIGARGLDHALGRGLIVADEPNAFAEEVIRFLIDGPAWEVAAAGAVAFAADWNKTQYESLSRVINGCSVDPSALNYECQAKV